MENYRFVPYVFKHKKTDKGGNPFLCWRNTLSEWKGPKGFWQFLCGIDSIVQLVCEFILFKSYDILQHDMCIS